MSKPDWAAIAREYRAGQLSIRALAEKYGISDTAIRKRQKRRIGQSLRRFAKLVRKPGMRTREPNHQKAPAKMENQLPEASGQETEFQFDPADYGLSEQQALFVHWFLLTKSRVDAYRKAGYKCRGNNIYPAASRISEY